MEQWTMECPGIVKQGQAGRAIMERIMSGSEQTQLAKDSFWSYLAGQEKKLFNFLRRSLHYSEDSADLYQEVVLRAWRYFPSFDRERSFPAWLFAIAHNEVKKHFNRRRHDRATLSLAQLAGDPAAPAPDADAALVLDAAGSLPARQREVFFLFYSSSFTVAEIASLCGLSQGNVKFILNRGREAVRKALEIRNGQ